MQDLNVRVRDNIILFTEDVENFFEEFLSKTNFLRDHAGEYLHDTLTAELETYSALPDGFQWPAIAGTESV